MEAIFAVYITLCVTVLAPMTSVSSWENQASSVTTTPPIGTTLPLKSGTGNHMDLICSAFGQPQKCGKLSLHSFGFNLICNEGYISNEFGGPSVYTLYVNGSWTPRIPECNRFCKPLKSHTVDIQCKYKEKDIDCNKPAPVGTQATGRCKMGYQLSEEAANVPIVCEKNGQWSHALFNCVISACGRKNSTESVPPWYVVIYRNDDMKCFGTLISARIVLTSAKCVYSANMTHKISPETLHVTVGNYDTKVRQILVHPYFFSSETNYAFNVALLDLETSVPSTPACVDWDHEIEITAEQKGTVVTRIFTVNYIQYEYVNYTSCVPMVEPSERRYLTACKLCFKRANGTIDTAYVRGNGLMLERNGIYYVKGIFVRWFEGWFGRSIGSIYLVTNLSDVGVLHWLYQTIQSIYAVHNGS